MSSASELLPSSKKTHAHPLAQFLTEEDYALADDARKEDEKKEDEYEKEITRRTLENRKIRRDLVPVGVDRENKAINERRKKVERDALKRYERDLTGTQVRTKDEINWQLRRKKVNKDLDINSLRWQEENRKRQLLALAENDITRDIRIQRGVELDTDDIFSSTTELTQKDLLSEADLNTKAKVFNLNLPYSNSGYSVSFNSSGRHLLISGAKNFLATLEWRSFKLCFEKQVNLYTTQATWMMDDTMIAVTGKKGAIVFNDKGEEIHFLKEFKNCRFIQYLPYHFTMVGASLDGNIKYKEISIGDSPITVVVKPITAFCQNRYNGIMICGHADGQVSMVTPRDKPMEPVVSMLCHKSQIIAIAVDYTGKFMVTSSREGITKVWEIKQSFKEICKYKSPAVSDLAISQSGMIALGIRNQILIWRDVSNVTKKNIYLKHTLTGKAIVTSLDFCPYEDILAIGTSVGVSQILVPGSGMPDFDSRTANPYSTDATVKKLNVDMLLEKVPLDMICLDPDAIGTSGLKQKGRVFDGHVKLTEKLKKDLNTMGIRQKVEKKKFNEVTRDELRREREEKDREFKQGVKEWYEEEAPNPLDRFASIGKRKRKNEEVAKNKLQKLNDDVKEEDKSGSDMDEDESNEILHNLQDSDEENLGEMYREIPEEEDDNSDEDDDNSDEGDEDDSDEDNSDEDVSDNEEQSDIKKVSDSDEDEEPISTKLSNIKHLNNSKSKMFKKSSKQIETDDSSDDSSDDEEKQRKLLAFSFGTM